MLGSFKNKLSTVPLFIQAKPTFTGSCEVLQVTNIGDKWTHKVGDSCTILIKQKLKFTLRIIQI